MTRTQEKSAAFIRNTIAGSMIPRNQIANISGLTNTYIRDLEQGKIANVSRTKLLKFSTAMGLGLDAIDEMLTVFDQPGLSTDDIPLFIKNAKNQRPSNSVNTSRDFFGYELMLLATESLAGPKTMHTNYPPLILQPEELRLAFMETPAQYQSHPIHNELRRSIGRERRQNLIHQLDNYEMHHYISKKDLEQYVTTCKDQRERQLKAEHLQNIRDFIETYPGFKFYLTTMETGFNCLLKHPEKKGGTERVFFYTHDISLLQGHLNGQIIGFYTGNKVIVEQFKKDLRIVKNNVMDEFRDTAVLAGYLTKLIDKAAP